MKSEDPEPLMWTKDDKPNPEWYEWAERNRTLDLGPSYGSIKICHGCAAVVPDGTQPVHKEDCPGTCIWKFCAYHNRSI